MSILLYGYECWKFDKECESRDKSPEKWRYIYIYIEGCLVCHGQKKIYNFWPCNQEWWKEKKYPHNQNWTRERERECRHIWKASTLSGQSDLGLQMNSSEKQTTGSFGKSWSLMPSMDQTHDIMYVIQRNDTQNKMSKIMMISDRREWK